MLKKALSRMVEIFSPTVLMQGQDYQHKGFVLTLRFSEGLLKARVKGHQGYLYDVFLDLKIWPDEGARCSCGSDGNCEHAAASMYALQARAGQQKSLLISSKHNLFVELPEKIAWVSTVETKGHDFFAYQLGILIDGEPVSIVPCVAELIAKFDRRRFNSMDDNAPLTLVLPEARVLQVTWGRIRPLIQFLLQYDAQSSKKDDQFIVNRYQLLLLKEVEEAMAVSSQTWNGAEFVGEALQRLINFDLPHVPPPVGLQANLRNYQQQGLNWLQFLRHAGLRGILADDMGLGKTVQTLAHLLVEKEAGRQKRASLVVVPTSLVNNWIEEAKQFAPALKVLLFHGTERCKKFADYDLVISTYGLIQRDKSPFVNYFFYYLILDEAQFIKNAYTKTTQIIYQLQAEHRLCLSGTPLENHLGELWSLFHFLMPAYLGDSKQFRDFFKIPIERKKDEEKRDLLARRVQPFLLRRNKNQVARELPEKTEIVLSVDLKGNQRDLYEAVRMGMEEKVWDAVAKRARSSIIFLDALLKLRQICCDPRLLSIPEAKMAYGTSAKLDLFMDLIHSLLEEGRRTLVFSQFTSMLKIIEERLQDGKYEYLKLTGQTRERQNLINTFQQGKIPIFLISLRAGGTGLNLTQADTVIHYDPWWNPAVERQATDRSHRIGQKNPVFVYKLITKGTVEEVILKMQKEKKLLFDKVFASEGPVLRPLSTKDIEPFFQPLPRSKS